MNLVKQHPEAHDAWLYAMGIDVRWRHREGLADGVDDGGMTADASALELPDYIVQTRYWVIGERALTDAQAYLLAGMMWAMGVTTTADCIYSYGADSTANAPTAVATGLPALATLNTLAVEPALLQTPIETIDNTIILLGDALMAGQTHERLLRVPSLQAMIDNPLLKKQAWAVLKSKRL